MNVKFLLWSLLILFGIHTTVAQQSKNIEKLKFDDYELEVVFFDPYENIVSGNPQFDSLDSIQQAKIWNDYLLNNVIYRFKLSRNKKAIKNYMLRGNPAKEINSKNLMRNTIYQLDIADHSNTVNFYKTSEYSDLVSATIDNFGFYGTLFDHMEIVEDSKRKLGKDIYGSFRLRIPYTTIRDNVVQIIGQDLSGEIDPERIAHDTGEFMNSFFDYQECIGNYFKIDRIEKIYVRTYNESGEIQNEYPRVEIDEDISSFKGKMNRLGDVASLPFFNRDDKPILLKEDGSSSSFSIVTEKNEPIEKYLEDIVVHRNSEGEIDHITATLLIHGSSLARGNHTRRENYIAYFKSFEDCRLPYRILYAPLTDEEFQQPRIEVQVDYLFYKK